MKLFLLIFFIVLSLPTFSSTEFQLEDSSRLAKVKDLYVVSCEKTCRISIRSTLIKEITSKNTLWINLIRELIAIEKPKSPRVKITSRKILYKVILNDGIKKISLYIGYSNIYKSEEEKLYKNLIQKVNNLKNAIRAEVIQTP